MLAIEARKLQYFQVGDEFKLRVLNTATGLVTLQIIAKSRGVEIVGMFADNQTISIGACLVRMVHTTLSIARVSFEAPRSLEICVLDQNGVPLKQKKPTPAPAASAAA